MTSSYLCIIQARLGSARFPNKVMQTVNGIPMVRRVWLAAKGSWVDKVIVAWPERYPDLDENNVLERFRRIAEENNKYTHIIRLTSDCPLLTSSDINEAIKAFRTLGGVYYNNRRDGHDVQVFVSELLTTKACTDKEHVVKDSANTGGSSVNTMADLERVRAYAR